MRNVHPYWQGERRRGSRDIIKEEEEWSGAEQSHPPLSSIDYSELSDAQLLSAITHIDNIVAFLERTEVKEWYSDQ
jgi:hypothetical protein